MQELIFLPWLNLGYDFSIGNYNFINYKLGSQNKIGHFEPEVLDNILSRYLNYPEIKGKKPEATIEYTTILLGKKQVIPENDILPLQNILCVCGLASRDFKASSDYLCADNFKLLKQKIPGKKSDSFDPLVSYPMKHGKNGIAFAEGIFREVRPNHIYKYKPKPNSDYRYKFDEELAQSIWCFFKGKGEQQKFWNYNLSPALFSFYSANTDGRSQQSDCIYSYAAFEQLLLDKRNCGLENILSRFNELCSKTNIIQHSQNLTNRNWQNIKDETKTESGGPDHILEAWLTELVYFRNCFAHGTQFKADQSVWTLTEHLVYSSYIFPLLLKILLNFEYTDSFQISDRDMNRFLVFPYLLDLEAPFKEDKNCSNPWTSTLSQVMIYGLPDPGAHHVELSQYINGESEVEYS